MKIAYVHDKPIPSQMANSVHVMKMCAALAGEGAEVTLFCPPPTDGTKSDPYGRYGVPANFKIEYVASNAFMKHLPSGERLSIGYKIAKEVMRAGIDVAFGRSMWALYFLRNKMPFIYETHMVDTSKTRFFSSALFKSPNLKKVIMITNGLKEDYLKAYPELTSAQIMVLQDGADAAKPLMDYNTPQNPDKLLKIDKRPVIGYLGHLLPGKCMEVLSQVAAHRPQYDFHVVGGKAEWVEKWQRDDRCRNLNNIRFYGFVDNKTIPYYYSNFDICLMPFSRNIVVGKMKNADIGRWTSPLKLFEAMAYGKAILSSSLETVMEVMTDGVNCLTASPEDIDAWCEKLDRLVADAGLRSMLGDNAKELFERNYTWAIRAKEIIKLCQ